MNILIACTDKQVQWLGLVKPVAQKDNNLGHLQLNNLAK